MACSDEAMELSSHALTNARLRQEVPMPVVPMRRDAQRFQRQQTCSSNRSPQVGPLGQRIVQVVVDGNVETSLARNQPGLRLNSELQLDPEQTEHVGDDEALEMGRQRLEVRAETRALKAVRHHQL